MDERIIIIIRHAQTELGRGKRYIGSYDVGLSKTGIKLSNRIGKHLQKYQFDHFFSSSLKRSKQMADILSLYIGQKVQTIDGFKEISLGDWDGCYIEDIKKKYPEEYLNRGKDLINFRPPGGENFLDLKERVLAAFHRILDCKGNILIISHSSVNRIILGEVLKIPLSKVLNILQDYGCSNMLLQDNSGIYVKLVNGSM